MEGLLWGRVASQIWRSGETGGDSPAHLGKGPSAGAVLDGGDLSETSGGSRLGVPCGKVRQG